MSKKFIKSTILILTIIFIASLAILIYDFTILISLDDNAPAPLPETNTELLPPPPIEQPIDKTPEDYTPLENLAIASDKIKKAGIYRTETSGTVTALGNIYQQKVKTYKKVYNNECFVQSASFSSIKKTAEQQYFNGAEILYRKGSDIDKDCNVRTWDTTKTYLKEDFLRDYGCEPFAITKYMINDQTIKSSDMSKDESGNYLLTFELTDFENSAANMIREIKTQSGAKEYPSFDQIKITVTMDSDWTVIKIQTEENYKIKMFISLTCSTLFEEVFSNIGNTQMTINEKEYFN